MGIGVYEIDAIAALKLAATPSITTTPKPLDPALEDAWIRYQFLYPQLYQWRLSFIHS